DNFVGKNSVSQTVHCAGVDGVQEGFQSNNLGAFYGNNIYKEYNTYGLEWTDEEYIFYINGVETRRTSFGNGVSEVPEEVIVSLEIPAEEELNKLDKDSYKTEYIIDYVRIYQK
ncbi:MAG: glycoside hydrolase family 16 protein, partial [Clostridia bacterium]|nr:glycoside hydrolase family 16 protein [Clostridia bacterium]